MTERFHFPFQDSKWPLLISHMWLNNCTPQEISNLRPLVFLTQAFKCMYDNWNRGVLFNYNNFKEIYWYYFLK